MVLYALQTFATAGAVKGMGYVLSYFFVCIAIVTHIRTKDEFIKIIDNFIYISGFLGILGIIEALTHHYFFQNQLFMAAESMGLTVRYGLMRAATTFGHPINFGMYQAFMAAFICYRITNKNISEKKRKIFILLFVVISVSVFASISRLGILLLLFSQIFIVLRLHPNRKIQLLISFLIVGGLTAVFFEAVGIQLIDELLRDLLGSISKMFGFGFGDSIEYDYGNRFDLYAWVSNKVKGHEIFGLGVGTEFSHKMSEWFIKTSIEVHYLYVYYMQGAVGVTGLILSYLGTLFYIHKRKNKKHYFEGNIGFNSICFVLGIGYYICLLGVQETDLKRLYNILVVLCICYNTLRSDSNEMVA